MINVSGACHANTDTAYMHTHVDACFLEFILRVFDNFHRRFTGVSEETHQMEERRV